MNFMASVGPWIIKIGMASFGTSETTVFTVKFIVSGSFSRQGLTLGNAYRNEVTYR